MKNYIFNKNFLFYKYYSLIISLSLFLISYLIYNFIKNNINILEFDSSYNFSLLINLINNGILSSATVFDALDYICNKDLICQFGIPESHTGDLVSVLPAKNTSGLSVYYIPRFIDLILNIFFQPKITTSYIINLYAIAAALIYFITNYIYLYFSKLNFSYLIRYFLISLIGVSSLLSISTSSLWGELYSGLFIFVPLIAIFFKYFKNISNNFYMDCFLIFLTGCALEAKLSVLFFAVFIFVVICSSLFNNLILNNFKNSTKIFYKLIFFAFIFLLPKSIKFIYMFFMVDGQFFHFFHSIFATVHQNASAQWSGRGYLTQLEMLFSTFNVYLLGISVITFFWSLVKFFRKKKFIWALFPLMLIFSLLFPLFFKFPYTRIFAYTGLVLSIGLFILGEFNKNRLFTSFYFLIMILLTISVMAKILHRDRLDNFQLENFYDYYPKTIFNKDSIFLTNDWFFGMPWDIYLENLISQSGPLYDYPRMSYQSLKYYKSDLNNIYAIFSCRWGHCPKENSIYINNYKCQFIEPVSKTNLMLYLCE